MCHGFDARRWDERPAETREDPEEPDEEPTFLNEEATEEVELLTDGGDEE